MIANALRALLLASSLVFAVLLVWLADRAVGAFVLPEAELRSLVFPARAEAAYDTYEFQFTARSNNLGLRGPDLKLERGSARRVLFVGDSYTYGWGVEDDQVWVRLVEQALRARGREVELANAAAPGMRPVQYAETVEELVPVLQPDLVVVGLLQGDDLRQSEQDVDAPAAAASRPPAWRAAVRRFAPNLVEWASRERERQAGALHERSTRRWALVTKTWEGQAEQIVAKLEPDARARFEAMEPALQRAFLTGKLNPYLLTALAWKLPPAIDELALDSPVIQRRIAAVAPFLARVRRAAERAGARAVGISLPHASYVSSESWEALRDLGRPSHPDELTTDVPDRATLAACVEAKLECFEVTEAFRARERESLLYYPLDTHMNALGNRLLAELLTPILERELFGSER